MCESVVGPNSSRTLFDDNAVIHDDTSLKTW